MKKRIYLALLSGIMLLCGAFANDKEANVFLYKTTRGDSLWNITERHLTDIKLWTELKKLNNLPDSNHIDPGTVIMIPYSWLKENSSTALLVNAAGEVTIIPSQGEKIDLSDELKSHDKITLFEGTSILTGENGLATLLFQDGSRLLLQSDSELVLEHLVARGDGSLNDIKLKLTKGRVESRVYSGTISNTNYAVATPVATTTVRGTDFRVSADGQEQSITEVVKGIVLAEGSNDNQSVELKEGEGTLITKEGGALKKLRLPEAPVFDDFPRIVEHVPIEIKVTEIKNVRGFDATIVPVGHDPKDSVSTQISQGNVVRGADLPDGRYQMYISAIDQKGLTGKPAMYDFILNARPFSPLMQFPESAAAIVEAKLKFGWEKANDDAVNYHFQIARDSEFRDLVVNEAMLTEQQFVAHNILGSGAYFWRIASIDKNKKRGPFSEAVPFRILLETPDLESAQVATSNITLKWAALEAGTQYRIQVSTDLDFKSIVLEKTIEQNAIMLTDVKPNTYFFRVQTIARDQFVSQWGEPQRFVIPDNPETPVRVSLSNP